MKPALPVAIVVVTFIIVQLGNGCSPPFRMIEDTTGQALASSCRSDESNLSSLSPREMRRGYLDQTEVLYWDRGDGWVQVDSDKLYLTKNGRLPEKPAGLGGPSEGVGVSSSDRWPNGIIPYVIDSSMPNQERITTAVNHWNSNLSGVIQFVPRTSQSDYVKFVNASSGCAAPVGYFAGAGIHPVDISSQCGSGNVAHEMGHVVGLDHEQNRLDRDSHVTINWNKISSGYEANFNIASYTQNYMGYDFGSIMHYALTAFSVDGSQTIIPKTQVPAGVTVGQRLGLSSSDINSARQIYGAAPIDTGTGGTGGTGTSGNGTGLFGHYYEGLDFTTLKREQIDSSIDFVWVGSPATGVSADYFSVRWNGWISPSASGSYSFVLGGQDGYRLKVNGVTMINNLSGSGNSQMVSSALTLNQGQLYEIVVEVVAMTGTASINVKWKKDGGAATLIPTTELIPNTQSAAGAVCTTN